jgi:hypothetical protein
VGLDSGRGALADRLTPGGRVVLRSPLRLN